MRPGYRAFVPCPRPLLALLLAVRGAGAPKPPTAAGVAVAAGVLAACLLAGCGGGKGQTTGPPPVAEPAAPTVSSDDLSDAEKVTRAYFEAVVKGDYAGAVSHMEGAASLSEEQRTGLEQTLRAGYETTGLTRVISIGPARQDPQSPRHILVPYSIAGKQTLAGDAIVRKLGPEGSWAVSGGI